jgi:hypothetical protein
MQKKLVINDAVLIVDAPEIYWHCGKSESLLDLGSAHFLWRIFASKVQLQDMPPMGDICSSCGIKRRSVGERSRYRENSHKTLCSVCAAILDIKSKTIGGNDNV